MKGRGAPKFIRSDNGGEFVARLIAVFLSQSGSGSHYIEPGKPWQNGSWSRSISPCGGITSTLKCS